MQKRTDSSKMQVPGETGVWVFVLGDMILFAILFGVFLYYRQLDIPLFANSAQLLNQHLGAINTLCLLTSSLFVASAVNMVRRGELDIARLLFGAGLGCGALFSVIKIVEYTEKTTDGIGLTTNNFFTYYFILTGIHFIHVIIGMGVLLLLMQKTRSFKVNNPDFQVFESGAIYWHMVDLLWIVLFTLLYLVR